MLNGEAQAWDILTELEPEDVCSRARVAFNKSSGLYLLRSFLQDIFISPKDKEIFSNSPESDFLLNKLGHYSKLSILWYLINAKAVPLSGELIKPGDMRGGQIYLRGTHVLPLDKIAEKYGSNIQELPKKSREFGGEQIDYGDVSVRLFPFPRVPVAILLWASDDEFPARADLLFDATCEIQLPADVIWSTAMMSVLIML